MRILAWNTGPCPVIEGIVATISKWQPDICFLPEAGNHSALKHRLCEHFGKVHYPEIQFTSPSDKRSVMIVMSRVGPVGSILDRSAIVCPSGIKVLGVHLYSGQKNLSSLPNPKGVHLITGDFNAPPGSPIVNLFTSMGFTLQKPPSITSTWKQVNGNLYGINDHTMSLRPVSKLLYANEDFAFSDHLAQVIET